MKGSSSRSCGHHRHPQRPNPVGGASMKGSSSRSCGRRGRSTAPGAASRCLNEGQLQQELRQLEVRLHGDGAIAASMKGSSSRSCGQGAYVPCCDCARPASMKGSSSRSCGLVHRGRRISPTAASMKGSSSRSCGWVRILVPVSRTDIGSSRRVGSNAATRVAQTTQKVTHRGNVPGGVACDGCTHTAGMTEASPAS